MAFNQEGKRVNGNTWTRVLLLVLLVLLLVAAVVVPTIYWKNTKEFYANRAFPETSIYGISVEKLTEEEIVEKITPLLKEKPEEVLLDALVPEYPGESSTGKVRDKSRELNLSHKDLGVPVSEQVIKALANRAVYSGRESQGEEFSWKEWKAGGKELVEIQPSDLDDAGLNALVEILAREWISEPTEFTYEVGEDSITFTKSRIGVDFDKAAMKRWLRQGEGDMPVTITQPEEMNVSQAVQQLSGEAKNAWYDVESGKCMDGQARVNFNESEAEEKLWKASPGQQVTIPAEVVEVPAVITAQELEEVLFRDKLSSYTTYVSGSDARLSNVKLSAQKCHGVVLNSGDIFDYNTTIGMRTYDAGYKDAPAYLNGQTVDQIGGGICQTSSTLYVAAVYANLETVSRKNHSFASSYVPLGYDATVSWGGPEFQFKNNTDYPVRIEVSWEGRNLTVTLWGTNVTGQYARMETEVLSKTDYKVVYETVKDLAPGKERVKQDPYTGYKCKTYRLVYSADGELLSRELENSSTYQVRNKIVQVGAKAETKPPETTVTPDPVIPDPVIPDIPSDPTGDLPGFWDIIGQL